MPEGPKNHVPALSHDCNFRVAELFRAPQAVGCRRRGRSAQRPVSPGHGQLLRSTRRVPHSPHWPRWPSGWRGQAAPTAGIVHTQEQWAPKSSGVTAGVGQTSMNHDSPAMKPALRTLATHDSSDRSPL